MTLGADAPPARPDARRNFILQQGLCDPAAGSCRSQYSTLLFQPWLVGASVVLGTILQSPLVFFSLAAVLWWSASLPGLNPFDALYNSILRRARGIKLTPAPPPRRFAQFLAGTFAVLIGVCLVRRWQTTAFVIEGIFIAAIAALIFGGFCFGSFVFHVVRGRGDFARRTLPWGSGT